MCVFVLFFFSRSRYSFMLLGKDVQCFIGIVFSFTLTLKSMWNRNSFVLLEIKSTMVLEA